MIQRRLTTLIKKRFSDNKAIIIMGPRQVGKTTLVQQLFPPKKNETTWWSGDDADIAEIFEKPTQTSLANLLGNTKILVVDEAQRIKNIGIGLKIILDRIPDIKVIATGSSSFDLANQINEPLTGRKWEFTLFPISFGEMVDQTSLLDEKRLLEHRLIYGYYPDVINHKGDETDVLKELTGSYLYKDILTWERIKHPERLEKLLQALAFQIGNEVSYNQLGNMIGLDNETVEKYIQLLEKAFVVFRLGSFSRNLRKELKKSRKIYFYDNGVRNSIVNQFNRLSLRNDTGALWENFLISERMKTIHYHKIHSNRYFWRTHNQQEVDYIEEREGKLFAFEFKWNTDKAKIPKTFLNAYPDAETEIIINKNFELFLLPKLLK